MKYYFVWIRSLSDGKKCRGKSDQIPIKMLYNLENQRWEDCIMTCKMEENSRLYNVLSALEYGYSIGEFEGVFPYLDRDCVMESQWVMTPNTGYDAVTDYFIGKGNALTKSGNFPECSIVELLGNCNPIRNASVNLNGQKSDIASVGLMYTPGKLCLEMRQTINEEEHIVIMDVSLNELGMVKRIDLCMPELFKYRDFYTFVAFYPATNDWVRENDDDENREHIIRVSEPYYDYLYLFMACAGEEFDEYEDLHISMDKWLVTLKLWKAFVSSSSFDEAFEMITGIDYETNSVKNPRAAKQLGRSGKSMWEDRANSNCVLEGLIEWTNLYKDTYFYINTIGW